MSSFTGPLQDDKKYTDVGEFITNYFIKFHPANCKEFKQFYIMFEGLNQLLKQVLKNRKACVCVKSRKRKSKMLTFCLSADWLDDL